MPFKKPDFNIDDAFSESSEDKIRLYSRSSEQAPLTEETIQVCWCGVVWCGVVWCGVVWCGSGMEDRIGN